MDLLGIIRSSIEDLPDGSHSPGLRAVLSHIEAAYHHLARGQDENRQIYFTDAVYRCNQAFEGSIKEAYRVLSEKDPSKISTYNIEKHLEDKNVFKDRVLAAFTNYRTEWRNPSTHDYMLDFGEAEAFLAIISVSAFSKLLIDQIAVEIAKAESIKKATKKKEALPKDFETWGLGEQVAYAGIRACEIYNALDMVDKQKFGREQAIGLVSGTISTVVSGAAIDLEARLPQDKRYRPDAIVGKKGNSVVVEVIVSSDHDAIMRAHDQLEIYCSVGEIDKGVLVAISDSENGQYLVYPFGDEEDVETLIVASQLRTFMALDHPFRP